MIFTLHFLLRNYFPTSSRQTAVFGEFIAVFREFIPETHCPPVSYLQAAHYIGTISS